MHLFLHVVAFGILTLPAPQILTHLIQRLFCLPVELLVRQGTIGLQDGDVTGTATGNLIGQITTDSLAEGLDHIQHRESSATAQVVGLAFVGSCDFVAFNLCQGRDMTVGTIEDMKVITTSLSDCQESLY